MPRDYKTIKSESYSHSLNINSDVEFEIIFKLYHSKLLHIAKSYVVEKEDAEEIVQETFIKLWQKRKLLTLQPNEISNYLFIMVKNGCLDYLRKKKRQLSLYGPAEQIEDSINYNALTDDVATDIIAKELAEQIRQAIELLPRKCQNVFVKSRVEGFNHKEISEKLQISTKTIESHIGKALKHMRFHLQEYLHLF
ncbi:RNA polymerase sigma-70 factor [Zobellia alginiliquefaciens]|uniref:RNA polymerase sigma-70 factor n=1 Tax=Zobellia alginiliquefaciens TaxID=3032586 RepID=UPI0023E4364D|nr:RNA polymerase sigma-70 factor [Zobellia alginiliquefaciens]